MAKIYAELIKAGRKDLTQVPLKILEDVKYILSEFLESGIITSEEYDKIFSALE